MKDIDFLPASYREQTVHRKANVWRLFVGGLFIAALACSAVFQQLLARETRRELAQIQPPYDQAQALIARQAELQKQLQAADVEAELLTYLRHPWPATQVLSAALAPLPDCITLQQVRLYRAPAAPATNVRSPPQIRPGETEAPKPNPAEHDLSRLREELDHCPTVLLLSGLTSDGAALQKYLVTLGEVKMFVKAELSSLESSGGERPNMLRFTARLVVRPGYGQPDGPVPQGPRGPQTHNASVGMTTVP